MTPASGIHHRIRTLIPTLAVIALAITACTPAGAASGRSATTLLEELCDDPRVVACTASPASITVAVGTDLPDADTLDVARLLHEAATASPPQYSADLTRQAPGTSTLDPEIADPAPWRVAVFPGELADAEAALTETLQVEDVPGTLGITSSAGSPTVMVATIEQFDDVFAAVSRLPMFEGGGTYILLSADEHLRIVHTPRWVNDTLIREVVAIARDHPQAEVLLEAPTGGEVPPTLYIARLTPDEVVALDARLAAIPDAAADGIRIEYVLGALGTDGVAYTGGVIGDET